MEGKDIEVEWKPFELRPEPVEPLDPNSAYIQNAWKHSVKPLAEKLGVEMNFPPVQPRTQLAFEGFQYAKENGKANEYNHRMLKAFFVEGMDLGDIDVLVKLAEEVGLDPDGYREAVESRKYRESHQAALAEAAQRDIRAVPTFFIGERKLQGLYPADRLAQIIDNELAKNEDTALENGLSCDIEGGENC
ncbi:DsbA family protein [Pseudalkalibacillus sp. SCS-8]|uniref:DsbA family oxidoreductase n=1 Tax=Pseudalkalibacillus nanhaiensis TaxID=3115291 RepID=UPI0032D9F8F0